jgi:hypothetical protein
MWGRQYTREKDARRVETIKELIFLKIFLTEYRTPSKIIRSSSRTFVSYIMRFILITYTLKINVIKQ